MSNPADMNDEDFLESVGRLTDDSQDVDEQEPEVDPTETPEESEEYVEDFEEGEEEEDPELDPQSDEPSDEDPLNEEEVEPSDEEYDEDPQENEESGDNGQEPKDEGGQNQLTREDLLSFYSEVTAPFRANGNDLQIKSAEDVRSLMKMGANYTKKMQEISPYRKSLVTLENNDLLDPDKINFLVDLYNKKPEAIKQLLKDSELSAYDLDTDYEDEDATPYVPEDHSPSDQELALRGAMEEVRALPGGESTIVDLTKTWDTESKNVLWENPGLLSTIHSQKQNGIYDTITREIERRQVLGQLPAHLPFINAYQAVGEELDKAGAFTQANKSQPSKPSPVAVTKGKAKKNATQNGDRAKAASISRGNSKHSNRIVDLTDLDDDKFVQAMSKII